MKRLTAHGVGALCRLDGAVLDAIKTRETPVRTLAGACGAILAGTAAYGFAFGAWRSPVQGFYSALKMPLLFFSTVLASAAINTMLAQLLGSGLSFRQVCTAMLFGMAICAAILGALCPVMLFFVLQVPGPDPSAVGLLFNDPAIALSTRVYGLLLLSHVGVVGAAGIAGNIRLYCLLTTLVGTRRMALRLMAAWMTVAGFVGCELSWMLSPFLCKPTQLPHLIPKEYFQENFYERVWHVALEVL